RSISRSNSSIYMGTPLTLTAIGGTGVGDGVGEGAGVLVGSFVTGAAVNVGTAVASLVVQPTMKIKDASSMPRTRLW
ncbi:MAG: hypothetical protein ABFQ89_06845, partial [Chloroflexota bacterium]